MYEMHLWGRWRPIERHGDTMLVRGPSPAGTILARIVGPLVFERYLATGRIRRVMEAA